MKRVLLTSAHPDDMEIGMGGTAAKLAESGDQLISVVFTDGRRAPDPKSIGPKTMAEVRKNEGEAAAKILGVESTAFFALESLATDQDLSKAAEMMKEVIDSFEPDEIFTLHPELDRHPSHRAAGQICIDALAQSKSHLNIQMWAYEVWGLFPTWDRFEDITDQIEKKLAAIAEHRSQIEVVPYDAGVAGLNRWRSVFADPHQSGSHSKFAEVFIKLN